MKPFIFLDCEWFGANTFTLIDINIHDCENDFQFRVKFLGIGINIGLSKTHDENNS